MNANSLPDCPLPDVNPHTDYHRAVGRFQEADQEHHAAQTAVACGTGSNEDMKKAAARLEWATDDFTVERHRVGRQLAEWLRIAAEDDTTAYAVLLTLLGILKPALEPVADRLAAAEERIGNLEVLAARKGVSR